MLTVKTPVHSFIYSLVSSLSSSLTLGIKHIDLKLIFEDIL